MKFRVADPNLARNLSAAICALARTMSRRNLSGVDEEDEESFYSLGGGASETQRLLVREQDSTIRSLASSVDRVQGMALRVNEELSSQNRLIEEIDEDVEKTDSRLRALQTQLFRLANDSDRGKYCVILILLIVLGVLTMMVLA